MSHDGSAPHSTAQTVDPNPETVELVGGPLCGAAVKWPPSELTISIPYHGGFCSYQREDRTKALYVKG